MTSTAGRVSHPSDEAARQSNPLARGAWRFRVLLGTPATGLALAVTVISTYLPVPVEAVAT